MVDDDLDRDSGKEKASQSLTKMISIIASVSLLIVAGALGGMFVSGFFDENTELVHERLYRPLHPSFVLNFEGKSKARYMQIALEVATSNDKADAALKKHMPVIRNEIVLLLSGQKYEELVTPEGKEQLRAEITETINKILKQHKVKKGIDNIYFTGFVMQ